MYKKHLFITGLKYDRRVCDVSVMCVYFLCFRCVDVLISEKNFSISVVQIILSHYATYR